MNIVAKMVVVILFAGNVHADVIKQQIIKADEIHLAVEIKGVNDGRSSFCGNFGGRCLRTATSCVLGMCGGAFAGAAAGAKIMSSMPSSGNISSEVLFKGTVGAGCVVVGALGGGVIGALMGSVSSIQETVPGGGFQGNADPAVELKKYRNDRRELIGRAQRVCKARGYDGADEEYIKNLLYPFVDLKVVEISRDDLSSRAGRSRVFLDGERVTDSNAGKFFDAYLTHEEAADKFIGRQIAFNKLVCTKKVDDQAGQIESKRPPAFNPEWSSEND